MFVCVLLLFVFFKQKTAYEMRISDWSSDVCSSDLHHPEERKMRGDHDNARKHAVEINPPCPPHATVLRWKGAQSVEAPVKPQLPIHCEIGRASCRARVCQYV